MDEYAAFEARAKISMLAFYDALEKRLKRHRPEAYGPYMAKRLKDSWGDNKKIRQTPPHRVLHSIEANCAYYKSGYDEPLDWSAMAKVMNVYNDHIDPLQMQTIPESLDRLFLMMHREQIELQRGASREYLARTWELFVEDSATDPFWDVFVKEYSLSAKKWIQLCFLAWAAADQNPECAFVKRALMSWSGLPVEEQEVEAFLTRSSLGPKEVGERFIYNREKLPWKFHSLIRSVFLEYPIIAYDNGRLIAPHPDLLFLHSGGGLYRLAKMLPGFDKTFGRSFERYTEQLLQAVPNKLCVLTEREVKKATTGKTCDFFIELPDSLLLVECKACMFTANLFTDGAIENDNSTGKVAKGLAQLCETARDIDAGLYAQFGIDSRKEVLGVVVTFGEMPMPNSDWYFTRFFLKRATDKQKGVSFPSGKMVKRPLVLSISTMEGIVQAMNTLGTSLLDLHSKKEMEPYLLIGDWEAYIGNLLGASGKRAEDLPLVRRNIVRFHASLGISEDDPPNRIDRRECT